MIRLSLVFVGGGYETPTPQFEGYEASGELVEVPNLYETHNVFAIADIESAGFRLNESEEKQLLPSQDLEWQWTLEADEEPGRHKVALEMRLRFVSKADGETFERSLWADTKTIETTSILGFSGPFAREFWRWGTVIGGILQFPLVKWGLDLLMDSLKKRLDKGTKKTPPPRFE